MIKNISNILVDGSSIIFDYPTYENDSQTPPPPEKLI